MGIHYVVGLSLSPWMKAEKNQDAKSSGPISIDC